MSWDPRAERITARAQAEMARAQAEQIRVQADITRARADAELEREDKRERQARRKEQREAVAATLQSQGHQVVPVAAIGAPMVIAWSGQYGFGAKVMHLGPLAPLLPVALEGGVLYSAMLTHRAIDADLPAGRYRAMTWAQAGIAAGMNFWHGVTASGGAIAGTDYQVGAAYGLTSLLSIVLLEATVALKAKRSSGRSAAQIRAGLVRRVRYPRLSVAAAAIGAARGIGAEAAWTAAWVDRYGIGPDSTRCDRKTARKILSAQRGADEAAAKAGELVIADGAIVRSERDIEVVGEPSESVAWVSAQEQDLTRYVSGGISECERWLSDQGIAHGSLRELPPPAAGERSQTADEPQDGQGERPKRRTVRRKRNGAGAADERLVAVRRLLTDRPGLSGAQIAQALGLPESTARRLRNRVLKERGQR